MSIKVIEAVRAFSRATKGPKFVLETIASHAHDDGTEAWMSLATLARETGYSYRQVQRHVATVRHLGELVLVSRPGRTYLMSIPVEKVENRLVLRPVTPDIGVQGGALTGPDVGVHTTLDIAVVPPGHVRPKGQDVGVQGTVLEPPVTVRRTVSSEEDALRASAFEREEGSTIDARPLRKAISRVDCRDADCGHAWLVHRSARDPQVIAGNRRPFECVVADCACSAYTDKPAASAVPAAAIEAAPRVDVAVPTQGLLIAPEVDVAAHSGTPAVFWRKDRPGWSCFLELPRGADGKRRRKRISGRTPDEVRTKYLALRELHERRLASGG